MGDRRLKVVLLAGGFGTRLGEETTRIPKPMVEVGGWPILWHIMKSFAGQGFDEFVVCLGYKGTEIKRFFLNYHALINDVTVRLGTGDVQVHQPRAEPWTVHLVETGLHTMTGGRVARLRHLLGDDPFLLTYGDGVSTVDLPALVDFHRAHGRLATVTAVRPPSRFGGLDFDGDLVTRFIEKPQIGEGWINGGFMVLEPAVLDYVQGDDSVLESDVLEQLADEGQLAAFRHDGFWQCMDTRRELLLLEDLWRSGEAPWTARW